MKGNRSAPGSNRVIARSDSDEAISEIASLPSVARNDSSSLKKVTVTFFPFFVAVTFFLLPIFSLSADTSAGKEEETLFMAKKAFEDGFYDASLGLLERFLKNYPDSAKTQEADLLAGECLYHQNKFTAALAKFEGLLKDPRSKGIKDAVYYWIAEVNFKGNNFTQASLYYKNIIQEFPASAYAPLAYYSLGWCLFQEHRFKEALGYFEALREKYPQEPQSKDAGFKIIECLYSLKDYAGIKGRIGLSIEAFPKDPLRLACLYFYLGEADYYLEDFNGAIAAYAQVLSSNPDIKIEAQALLGLGWSYLKLKRYAEAEDVFLRLKQEGLEKRSRDILLLGRAIVSMEANRIDQAKKLYEELLNQTNDPLISAQGLIGRADALYNLADYAEASKAYQEALVKINLKEAASQTIDRLYYNLGCSLLKQGHTAEAINEFQKIIGLDNFDDAAYTLGLAYYNKQDYHSAKEMLKKFQEAFKESDLRPKALYLLGSCLYALGDYPAAIRAFQEIPRLAGIEAELAQKAEYAAADAFYQMGEEQEALSRFKALRAKYPGSSLSPDVLWWLGSYYYQHNEPELARRYFLSLIQDFPKSNLLADAGLHLKIAEIQEARGSLDDAIKEYLEAARLSGEDNHLTATALLRLGRIYEDRDNLQEARKVYAKILEMNIPESKYAEERITNLTFP